MDEDRMADALAWRALGYEVYLTHEEYLQAGFPHAAEWDSDVHYPAFWDEANGYAWQVPALKDQERIHGLIQRDSNRTPDN